MIRPFLNYLKQLATEHKEFNHSATNTAYYEHDWQGFMDLRNRNRVVLFVHRIAGNLGHNRGDYETDQAMVHLVFFTKLEAKEMTKAMDRFLECQAYAREFIARMRYDRRESQECDLNNLLRHLTLNGVEYEQTELTDDGWMGCEVRLPFTSFTPLDFDAEKWNLTE